MPLPTLLAVVAHPDDETFGLGSVIAEAVAHDVVVTVACATRGEAGSPTPGSVPDGVELAQVREAELRAAASLLGVEDVEVGDWRDSDMGGEPAPGTLCAAPLDDVTDWVLATIDRVRPHDVVTLDGSDGHRDHVWVREATLAAVEQRDDVERVHLHCLPQELMVRWAEELRRRDPDAPYLAVRELGTSADRITTRIDTSRHRELRDEAVALHRSQTPPFAVMPDALADAFLDADALTRVRPPWSGGPTERRLYPA